MAPVAGSIIWLLSDTEVYQETGATTPASNGSTVGYWKDQSGNNNHFTASGNDTTRPTYVTNILNGYAAVRADGSNDRLGSVGNITLTNFTIHCVFISRQAPAQNRVLYQYDGSDGWMLNNGAVNTFYNFNTDKACNGSVTTNIPTIVTISRGSGAMSLRINGNPVNTGTITVPTTIDEIYMFASVVPNSWGQLDMLEVLVYDSLLSSGNIDTNEAYLATRYATPLEVAGTQLIWLKSDTEIYQEIAASTAADADNDTVGYWKDQSGKGNHFTSVSDGTQRPTIQTGIINGYPVVRFDGVNDYLRSICELWLKEFTVAMMVRPRAYGSGERIFYHFDGTSGVNLSADIISGVNHYTPDVTILGSVDTFAGNVITLEKVSGFIKIYRDGTLISSGVLSSTPTVIDEIFLGIAAALNFPGHIDLAELIVRRGVDSTTRASDVTYLANKYDLVPKGTWVELADMLISVEQHAIESLGGKIYLCCGIGVGSDEVKILHAYDPATDTWDDTLTSIPGTKRQSISFRAVNGKIYCIGGHLGSGALPMYADVYEYNPGDDTWATKTSMPTAREDMGSAAYDGKIYVFGGLTITPGPIGVPIDTLEVYTPGSDSWDETKADLPDVKWSGDFGVAFNGKIYAIGSTNTYASYPALTPIYTVYEYDPVGDAWTQKADLPGGASYKDAVHDSDYIYVVCGAANHADAYMQSVWRYNPTDDLWQYVGLAPYKARGTAATVYNGEIYLSGGYDGTFLNHFYKLTDLPTKPRVSVVMVG